MFIDSHCHIDLYDDPRKVLNESEKAGIVVMSMTNLPSHFEMGFPFFLSSKKIRLALGMHPLYAQYHETEFPKFESNFSKTSYIGEVGLDFSREGYETKEIQLKTFIRILKLVSGKKKILSIHSRRAEKEVLQLLTESEVTNAIFHWYTGPLYLIDSIVEAQYHFSINPAMVKSDSGRKVIQRIPLDRILTETDGPFVQSNGVALLPGEVNEVIDYLSLIHKKDKKEIHEIIKVNFMRLLNWVK